MLKMIYSVTLLVEIRRVCQLFLFDRSEVAVVEHKNNHEGQPLGKERDQNVDHRDEKVACAYLNLNICATDFEHAVNGDV
jgi:hypothetical protein